MAYIKTINQLEIGTKVVTIIEHKSMGGKFEIGSEVIIIGIDPIRGYSIQDNYGNKMIEIGWVI